jgi:hypothetical protein
VSKYLPMSVSRAEVIADLDIYRRSGLAELDRAESPDVYGNAYIGAKARGWLAGADQGARSVVARAHPVLGIWP